MLIILSGLATILLLALLAYACHLQRRLKTLEEKQHSAALDREKQRQQLLENASRGIQILAGALVREEVTLTEGCMRIAYLLTQVDEDARQKQEYSVFFQLAEATAHIPVLDAWRELSKQKQRAFNKERTNTEEAFQEFVVEAAQQLLNDSRLKHAKNI
jgi:uncharacterized protein DUF2489